MFLPDIAIRIFPDWNVRAMTARDAAFYCAANKICVSEADDEVLHEGLYTVYKDVEFIVLNRTLDPEMKAWVWLHEIFHRQAHYPQTSYFSKSMEVKNDAEANTFAAVALLPRPLIETYSVDEICWYYNIPRPLVIIRKMVADNYQI